MKVEWTNPAVDDVLAIKNYIARDSEAYAQRFAERMIRELTFGNYRIIYRLEEQRVLLLTVIHGARNLLALEPKPWELA